LSALLVEVGNGLGIQMVGVGEKTIFLAGLLILIADKAEWIWDGPKQDGLIPGDSRRFAAPALVQVFDSSIAFQTGDKIDAVGGQGLIPAVVSKTHIEHCHGTSRQFQGFGPVDLMGFAIGKVHELRQVAIAIKTHMDIYGSLGLAEFGPGEHGQAEINDGDVKQVELAAEFESVFGSKLPGFLQQLVEHSLIQLGGLLFVHSGQGCPGARLYGQVVQLVCLGGDVHD